ISTPDFHKSFRRDRELQGSCPPKPTGRSGRKLSYDPVGGRTLGRCRSNLTEYFPKSSCRVLTAYKALKCHRFEFGDCENSFHLFPHPHTLCLFRPNPSSIPNLIRFFFPCLPALMWTNPANLIGISLTRPAAPTLPG